MKTKMINNKIKNAKIVENNPWKINSVFVTLCIFKLNFVIFSHYVYLFSTFLGHWCIITKYIVTISVIFVKIRHLCFNYDHFVFTKYILNLLQSFFGQGWVTTKDMVTIEEHVLGTYAGKTVFSCHRCLYNTGVEKMNNI